VTTGTNAESRRSGTTTDSAGGATRWLLAGGLAILAALLGALVAWVDGHRGLPLYGGILSLAMLFVPLFLLGLSDPGEGVVAWLRRGRARVACAVAALLVPYLLYAVSSGALSWVSTAQLAIFLSLPTVVALSARRRGAPRWQDAVIVLVLWISHELGWLREVWSWPEGMGGYVFDTVMSVDLVLVLFLGARGLDGVGYRFRFGRADLRIVLVNFSIFAAIGIPVGLATGFLTFNPRFPDPLVTAVGAVGLFLTVALPEELLFRGVIQNLLQRVAGSGRALLAASILFGASHLDNDPSPDWRYFLLASIAGLFYGRAYLQSRGLMAPIAVHTLVDVVWRAFLR
jgi:membrane protease YdiL (CAAX protease family)